MKKILRIAFWCLFVIGLAVTMSFVQREHSRMKCMKPKIVIHRVDANFFVSEDDIMNLLRQRGDSIEGQPVSAIHIPELEKVVATHPAIESVEAYMAVNGEVRIEVTQRHPLVRIINTKGESYYIDDKGKLMPWMDEWTAHVPVATGLIMDGYDKYYMKTMAEIEKDSATTAATPLDDIYRMAVYIAADTFFSAQITQLNYTKENGFELIPRVGAQRILFGEAVDIAEKFNNLEIFYREGLSATGKWNDYSTINLQYKNQVVCTRKEEPAPLKPADAAAPAQADQHDDDKPAADNHAPSPKPQPQPH